MSGGRALEIKTIILIRCQFNEIKGELSALFTGINP